MIGIRRLCVVVAIGATQTAPLKGNWAGSFETPHGGTPVRLSVPPTGRPTFEMEFMGNRVAGTVDSLVEAGDSVRFVLGFETLQGSGAFKFRGLATGPEASGVVRGYLDGREMSSGSWSLKQVP